MVYTCSVCVCVCKTHVSQCPLEASRAEEETETMGKHRSRDVKMVG